VGAQAREMERRGPPCEVATTACICAGAARASGHEHASEPPNASLTVKKKAKITPLPIELSVTSVLDNTRKKTL
jgi:hypothetical protein